MRKFFRALGSGIGITIIVTMILSVCLWFLGGYLGFGEWHPFDSVLGRFVGLAILWIIALFVILIILLTKSKKDENLADDIVTAAEDVSLAEDEVVTEELGEMRDKLKTAMVKLRKSKQGRRHIYQLPWYIMIGPPGAGKTTAIVNSGLQFPLADEMGKTAIGGVGGTRNCDWWFTDNAVLVDTAGRYTTQESDAEADNAAWLGFLALLKKHRKRQPINGAIIAISLADLSMQDEVTQQGHAAAIRRRLHELREKLGVHFPVYILFTKADLIAGFNEFYETLGKEERGQVWGFTLPLARKKRSKESPIALFDEEFSLLLNRLNDQSLEKMQSEADPQRRSMIASFPSQVASVRGVARDFLSALFQDNKFEHRQLLRGVYFTSGTQEGTPIDRLMMGMARTFGIGRQAIGSGKGTGRSYFLTQLFDRVIFPESGLVSADDRVERRYRWTKVAGFVAVFLAAVGMGSLWARSYIGNADMLDKTRAGIESYQTEVAAIPPSPVGDTDLLSLIPALNTLRDLPNNDTLVDKPRGDGLGWGLYQGKVLGNQERLTYRASLNKHFLPRLLLRLENQMQANINNADLLYEALKIYLTLGQVGPMNRDLVGAWMMDDWEQAFPDTSREPLRNDLKDHLDALLSAPLQPIALNNDLVEAVQRVLTQMPQSQRVYNGIINSKAATSLPQWRVTAIGGPAVTRAFSRSSGKQLNDGIPGIYTFAGFNEVFLEEALTVATRIQRESWVLGEDAQQEQSQAVLLAMSRDVLDLYYSDFILHYDTLMGDIDIIPMGDLPSAVEVTNVLSGATSPIRNLLTAIAEETRLTEDRSGGDTTAAAAEGAESVGSRLIRQRLSVNSRIFLEAMAEAQEAETGQKAKAPGQFVEDHYAWLHRLTASADDQPSQLDELIDVLKDVYQDLSNLNFAGGVGNPQETNTALPRFQAAVGRIEDGPLKRWASQITIGSSGIATEGTRAGINAAWQENVLPICERVTTNTYPFKRRARADAGINDFAQLFRPDGDIDKFFKTNLSKFVDRSKSPWTFKKVNNTDLGVSQAVLKQFEYAADIRDAFFAGAAVPNVGFQITPEALDPKARGILLEIDGQAVTFRHRDKIPRPAAIRWPGPVGAARVTFTPEKRNSESAISQAGTWAWFRMLDAAEIRNTNAPGRKRVIFNIGGRIAIFQMQTSSPVNPFALPALAKFSCPKSF